MTTSGYSGAFDVLNNPNPTGALGTLDNPPHAQQHVRANDAIEAIQAELGVNPAGAFATVVARLDGLLANLLPLAGVKQAFGVAGDGLFASRWNHQHPVEHHESRITQLNAAAESVIWTNAFVDVLSIPVCAAIANPSSPIIANVLSWNATGVIVFQSNAAGIIASGAEIGIVAVHAFEYTGP